jgi:CBS domain-containing protein
MLSRLAWVNVSLVVFNLIPAFPMDGGRVLRALLAMRLSYARATQIAATIGQGLAFLFGFLGLLYNPLLIFIAIFLYMGAAAEAGYAQIKEATAGLQVTEAMSTDFIALPPEAPLEHAVEVLRRTRQSEFPVVGSGGNIVGILTRENLIRGLHSAGPHAQVASVMHANVPTVKYNASFDHAFRVMQECQCPGVGVVGNDGRLIGLLTPETVGEMLMIQSLLPRDGKPSWKRNETPAAKRAVFLHDQ